MFTKGFKRKKFIRKRAGVYAKVITGKNAQLAWCRLMPGEETDHKHNHEQIGYILSGSLKVTISGESKKLGPGDAYCIPQGAKHGFKVLGDKEAQYFEIFSPPKEENIQGFLFQEKVQRLSDRFNEPIIPVESIRKWLDLFKGKDRATALMLIEKIEFHSQVRLIKETRALHAKLQERLAAAGFDAKDFSSVDFSREFTCKSGDVVSYIYRKANLIPAIDFKTFDQILREGQEGTDKNRQRALVILDDYIGTGSQFIFHFIAESKEDTAVVRSYKKVYLACYVMHESAVKKFQLLKQGRIEEVIDIEKAHFPDADFSTEEKDLRENLKNLDWSRIEPVFIDTDRPLLADSNNLLSVDEKKKARGLLKKFKHEGYSGPSDLMGHHTFFYGAPNALPYIFWPLFKRVEDLSTYTASSEKIIAEMGKVTRYNIEEVSWKAGGSL